MPTRSSNPDRQLWNDIHRDPQRTARLVRDYAADQLDALADEIGQGIHADAARRRAKHLREF